MLEVRKVATKVNKVWPLETLESVGSNPST